MKIVKKTIFPNGYVKNYYEDGSIQLFESDKLINEQTWEIDEEPSTIIEDTMNGIFPELYNSLGPKAINHLKYMITELILESCHNPKIKKEAERLNPILYAEVASYRIPTLIERKILWVLNWLMRKLS